MAIILSIYSALIVALTYAEYNRREHLQAWLKPLAALGFILIAIFGGALYWDFGRWVLWGLISCAVGDVLLLSRNSPLKFKLGMAAFAIGHLLYVWAFINHTGKTALAPWMFLPLIAGIGYFVWIRSKAPKDMIVPVAIYTMIIMAMVIFSFTVPIAIIPLAAILFSISDMFVARDRFVSDEPVNAVLITPLYFGAQALFALAASIG